MTAEIRVGGETVEWGEDDVADFLEQYGMVTVHRVGARNVLYLNLDTKGVKARHNDPSCWPYLYAYQGGSSKKWYVRLRLPSGGYSNTMDVMDAVEMYKELMEEKSKGRPRG